MSPRTNLSSRVDKVKVPAKVGTKPTLKGEQASKGELTAGK